MTIDEMIAILQAAKAGKAIQFRADSNKPWMTAPNPHWSFGTYEYRVKPEAREWLISTNGMGCNLGSVIEGKSGWHVYEANCTGFTAGAKVIRVREVLDEEEAP